jgi:hypothetical protein
MGVVYKAEGTDIRVLQRRGSFGFAAEAIYDSGEEAGSGFIGNLR